MKIWMLGIPVYLLSMSGLAETYDTCHQSDAYALYWSQNASIDFHSAVQDIMQMQKAEHEITRESGVRDLALERALTIKLSTFRELRERNFNHYKKLGGKASSVEKVRREIPDPCT